MKKLVIIPGGFHPFHAGHLALYQSAKKAFPDAEVYVAATNDQSERPFPFALKEKLAKLAGVEPGHFIQVKSPFQAKEITQNYDPDQDVLIFVRSEKDRTEQPQPGVGRAQRVRYGRLLHGVDLLRQPVADLHGLHRPRRGPRRQRTQQTKYLTPINRDTNE